MNYKLLIVEDEDIIRRGLVYSVDWQGMGCSQVLQAADGQEAVEVIGREKPDILIMDINIPFLSGLEVLEQTREEEYAPIILSGYAEFAYAQKALREGAVRFLLKPVDFGELAEAVEAAKEKCRQKRAYQEFRKAEEGLKAIDLFSDLEAAAPAQSQVVCRILKEVEHRYSEKLTIRELAAQLHYSETFLIHKFKEEMKMGFSAYLTRYRLQKAIQLLRAGETRVSYVAEACGFPNSKYFNSVFRKHVGCLPKEYLALSGRK